MSEFTGLELEPQGSETGEGQGYGPQLVELYRDLETWGGGGEPAMLSSLLLTGDEAATVYYSVAWVGLMIEPAGEEDEHFVGLLGILTKLDRLLRQRGYTGREAPGVAEARGALDRDIAAAVAARPGGIEGAGFMGREPYDPTAKLPWDTDASMAGGGEEG